MTAEELTGIINAAVEQALAPIREQVNAAVALHKGEKPAAAGTGTGEGAGAGSPGAPAPAAGAGKGSGAEVSAAAAAAAAAGQQKTPEQEAEERMHQAVEDYIKNPDGLSEGRKF